MKKLNYAVLLLISLYALTTLTLVLINNATAAKSSITIEKGSSSPKAKQMYSPASLTIKKGTTVTWTNDDITLHTVTSGSPDLGDSGAEFDSSYLAAGKSFDFRFEKNGKFDYYCTLHPFMKGIIQVTALGKNPILSNQKNQTAPLTSIQDKGSFLIRMTPLVEGYLYPSSNVTINKGTTVIWKNIFDSEVYIKSSADLDHYEGEVLDSGLLPTGETFSYKFNEKGSFPYTGSNGIEGVVNVVDGNNSINANIQKKNLQINASANNLNINQIKWINFTDDQSLFSVEYPSQWTAKAGNRFTDDPPLMVENMNGNQTIAHSKFEVMIFGNENLSSLKWAQLKKRELVDSIKDTKLVEPIRCEGYNIDGVQLAGLYLQ